MNLLSSRSLDEGCATVVFLRNAAVVTPAFYLGMKKQNIHIADKEIPDSTVWNGYGGKWQKRDKTISSTAKRELFEESGGVTVSKEDLTLGARVEFFWPGNVTKKRNMEVFFFVAHRYSQYPKETSEMGKPELFTVRDIWDIPMMPADRLIIPIIMSGKKVSGRVYFGKDDNGSTTVLNKELSTLC
jgi:hypothetical protein